MSWTHRMSQLNSPDLLLVTMEPRQQILKLSSSDALVTQWLIGSLLTMRTETIQMSAEIQTTAVIIYSDTCFWSAAKSTALCSRSKHITRALRKGKGLPEGRPQFAISFLSQPACHVLNKRRAPLRFPPVKSIRSSNCLQRALRHTVALHPVGRDLWSRR